MTKGAYSNGSNQFFDSHAVEEYYGRFKGTFELDEDDAREFQFDDAVSFLITTRVDGSSFGTTRDDEIKRTNTFQVYDVVPLSAEMYERIMSGKLEETKVKESAMEELQLFADVDEDTGEITPAEEPIEVEEVQEEEVFIPEPADGVERIAIPGAYNPDADEPVEVTADVFQPDKAPVTRVDGKDAALSAFLEV